jgi:hypothetical protein
MVELTEGPSVVALVTDLIDRSRIQGAIDGVRFAGTPTAAVSAGGDVVVVDLARFGAAVGSLRAALPDARIVGFGPHVDDVGAEAARAAGADLVVARSRFFRQIRACVLSENQRSHDDAGESDSGESDHPSR